MADEPNLRHLFGQAPTPAIDVSSVLRRSRARRAPRLLGAGAVAVLAVCTIAYGGFAGLSSLSGTTATDAGGAAPLMESESDGGASATTQDLGYSSSRELSYCGAPVVEIPPSETGLVLSLTLPAVAEAGAASIDGTVTMTNAGTVAVTGASDITPIVTLAQGGTVVWHTEWTAPTGTQQIDLAPGESIDFAASLSPVVCGIEDDEAGTFRTSLPAAPAGRYEVSAAIDVQEETRTTVVGSAPTTIELR